MELKNEFEVPIIFEITEDVCFSVHRKKWKEVKGDKPGTLYHVSS